MYFCLFFGGMGDRGYAEETTDDVDEREDSNTLEDPNDVGVTMGQYLWEDINCT